DRIPLIARRWPFGPPFPAGKRRLLRQPPVLPTKDTRRESAARNDRLGLSKPIGGILAARRRFGTGSMLPMVPLQPGDGYRRSVRSYNQEMRNVQGQEAR